MGKIFLRNPYPAQRKEVLKIRFKSYSNISITNAVNNEILVPDTDYQYSATRIDDLDGLILGKTFKITFNTPKCFEQCESCTEQGIEEH